jgi:hypothetical protein
MPRLGLLTLLAFIMPSSASATIIPMLQSGPIPISSGPFTGDFAFNYVADLSSDERLDPVATNGVTGPGPAGVKANGTTLTFHGFQIVSTSDFLNQFGTFTGQATLDIGDNSGNTNQAVGPESVPGAPAPDPGTLTLSPSPWWGSGWPG